MSEAGLLGMRQSQRGVALISVLLVFALATIIAGDIASRNYRDIKRTASWLNNKQAYHFAMAGEQFARQILYRDFVEQGDSGQETNSSDGFDDNWANIDQVFDIDDGKMTIEVNDLQSRFNLNNLINSQGTINNGALAEFSRLLDTLDLAPDYADQLADWLDTDSSARVRGAEDDVYLGAGYLPANHLLVDRSELRLLSEMTNDDYNKLKDVVAALPKKVGGSVIERSKYNINTADAKLLQALSQQDTSAGGNPLNAIKDRQQQGGYASVAEWQRSGLLDKITDLKNLDTRSNFFEVIVTVQYAQHTSIIRSHYHRSGGDGSLSLLKRQLGSE